MFTRPRFRAVRRTAQQHEVLGPEFVSLAGHLVRHAMINLQIGRIHLFQIDEALAAILLDELFFNSSVVMWPCLRM